MRSGADEVEDIEGDASAMTDAIRYLRREPFTDEFAWL